MDQESSNGRRRSSRLAARGITTTPRAEAVVKKTFKSTEKRKRSKRKTSEDVIELPEPKKTKTETSSDEVDKPEIINTNNVEKNEVSAVTPMDVDNSETNVSPPSSVEKNDKPTIEDKTDPSQDSKEQEIVENIPVTNEDKEKVDTPVITDDKNQSEITEDPFKIKDPETIEPPKNDVLQEETKQEPAVLENSNGTTEDKKTVESMEVINNSDIGFCVATKDIVTPNGDANVQVTSTNGDQTVTKPEAIEPIKVLREDKNHVVETEVKAVTTPTIVITTTNNDVSSVEQVEKELDKVVDNVDNKSISADDNAPNVDQSSTVVS